MSHSLLPYATTLYSSPWIFPPLAFYGADVLLRLLHYQIKDDTLTAQDAHMTLVHKCLVLFVQMLTSLSTAPCSQLRRWLARRSVCQIACFLLQSSVGVTCTHYSLRPTFSFMPFLSGTSCCPDHRRLNPGVEYLHPEGTRTFTDR